ncbi:MAG: Rieske 2Fe-2S domain-containing protein [Gemmataceae bacterium]
MKSLAYVKPSAAPPPEFHTARNQRQKTRTAGLHPDYWYPVEYAHKLQRGQAIGVQFWNRDIVVYRGEDGQLAALEDRCAHRQLKLSLGVVEGCNLTCVYHGWSYDRAGKVTHVSHDLFGRPGLKVRLPTYPVQERYGLIWIFPGDPARATQHRIPDIPELEGPNAWPCVPIDFTWRTHHSMVLENTCDLTHAYLHRRYRPFLDAKLTRCDAGAERVEVEYAAQVGRGKISGLFVDRDRVDTNSIILCYEYPYQWSSTGSKIKNWCFLLPMDERTTRVFFLFYFDCFRFPFTSIRFPHWLTRLMLRVAERTMIRPLLSEDGVAVEAEQAGFEVHYDEPMIEINPIIHEFQLLTIRKWEEYLAGKQVAACRADSPNQAVTNEVKDEPCATGAAPAENC